MTVVPRVGMCPLSNSIPYANSIIQTVCQCRGLACVALLLSRAACCWLPCLLLLVGLLCLHSLLLSLHSLRQSPAAPWSAGSNLVPQKVLAVGQYYIAPGPYLRYIHAESICCPRVSAREYLPESICREYLRRVSAESICY